MPAGIIPNEGIADQLSWVLATPTVLRLNWELVLFVNDITVDYDTVYEDLTEATWAGYSRMQLDMTQWQYPTVFEGCATATYGTLPVTYNVGVVAPDTINYGVAYYDPGYGVLRWVQTFDADDQVALVTGGRFSLVPQYTYTTAQCASSMMALKRKIKTKRKKV